MSRITHPDGLPSPQAMSRTLDRKILVLCAVVIAFCSAGYFTLHMSDRYRNQQLAKEALVELQAQMVLDYAHLDRWNRRSDWGEYHEYLLLPAEKRQRQYPSGFPKSKIGDTNADGTPRPLEGESDQAFTDRVRKWAHDKVYN